MTVYQDSPEVKGVYTALDTLKAALPTAPVPPPAPTTYEQACVARPDLVRFDSLTGTGPLLVDGLTFSTRFTAANAKKLPAPDLPSAGTICLWIQPTNLAADQGWNHIAGRVKADGTPILSLNIANTGQLSARQDTTGLLAAGQAGADYAGTYEAEPGAQVVQPGDTMFVAVTFGTDTGWLEVVLNGALHVKWPREIGLPAPAIGETLRVGPLAGTQEFLASGLAVFSSRLTVDELRGLMKANKTFTAPANGDLGSFPGRVYGSQKRPVTDLPSLAATSAHMLLLTLTQRPTSRPTITHAFGVSPCAAGLSYWDGLLHTILTEPPPDNVNPFSVPLVTAAGLHRYKPHPDLLRLAVSLMDQVLATQDATTGNLFQQSGSGAWGQILNEACTAAMLLRKDVDTAKLASWVAKLERAGEAFYQQNRNWVINGNQNLGMALICYCLSKLGGVADWTARYAEQWAHTVAPTDAVSSDLGPARTAGYGLYKVGGGLVANIGALADTDACYLAEWGENHTAKAGVDWDYLRLQAVQAWRLYYLTGKTDPVVGKLARVLFNAYWTRMRPDSTGRGPWLYDRSGGTRRPTGGDTATVISEYHLIPMIAQLNGWVSGIDSSQIFWAGRFPADNDWEHGSNGPSAREPGTDEIGVLAASANWPAV